MSEAVDLQYAIQAFNVTRYYGLKRGVREFSLNVPTGTIWGLLGENGSGKTTALKLAMGMLLPNAGEILTLGVNADAIPPEVRARIGWLSDQLAVPDRFPLKGAMALQRSFFPTWNQKFANDLAELFDLTPESIFGQLSLGQKRRYMLLLVIAQMPELLVLDEPAGGLDPAVRRQLIDLLIQQASERPITIILSSHIMSDVERLVDHVAFMKDGQVIANDNLENLRARIKRICSSKDSVIQETRQKFNVLHEDSIGDTRRLIVDDFDSERCIFSEAILEHLNLEELFVLYNDLDHSASELR